MIIHRAELLKEIKELFPELRSKINSEHGILTLEIHQLTNRVQAGIDGQDRGVVTKGFQLADKVLDLGSPDLVSSFLISFVEKLQFDGNREWARRLMSNELSRAFIEMSKYGKR